jgi:hypothetical protein
MIPALGTVGTDCRGIRYNRDGCPKVSSSNEVLRPRDLFTENMNHGTGYHMNRSGGYLSSAVNPLIGSSRNNFGRRYDSRKITRYHDGPESDFFSCLEERTGDGHYNGPLDPRASAGIQKAEIRICVAHLPNPSLGKHTIHDRNDPEFDKRLHSAVEGIDINTLELRVVWFAATTAARDYVSHRFHSRDQRHVLLAAKQVGEMIVSKYLEMKQLNRINATKEYKAVRDLQFGDKNSLNYIPSSYLDFRKELSSESANELEYGQYTHAKFFERSENASPLNPVCPIKQAKKFDAYDPSAQMIAGLKMGKASFDHDRKLVPRVYKDMKNCRPAGPRDETSVCFNRAEVKFGNGLKNRVTCRGAQEDFPIMEVEYVSRPSSTTVFCISDFDNAVNLTSQLNEIVERKHSRNQRQLSVSCCGNQAIIYENSFVRQPMTMEIQNAGWCAEEDPEWDLDGYPNMHQIRGDYTALNGTIRTQLVKNNKFLDRSMNVASVRFFSDPYTLPEHFRPIGRNSVGNDPLSYILEDEIINIDIQLQTVDIKIEHSRWVSPTDKRDPEDIPDPSSSGASVLIAHVSMPLEPTNNRDYCYQFCHSILGPINERIFNEVERATHNDRMVAPDLILVVGNFQDRDLLSHTGFYRNSETDKCRYMSCDKPRNLSQGETVGRWIKKNMLTVGL